MNHTIYNQPNFKKISELLESGKPASLLFDDRGEYNFDESEVWTAIQEINRRKAS